MREIYVTELYTSFQGEGPYVGRQAIFLRLAGCNLSCSWCDSRFSWDKKYPAFVEPTIFSTASLTEKLRRFQQKLCVVTGGEPLLQEKALAELSVNLAGEKELQIETNGTKFPHMLASSPCDISFIVSPKLANSGMPEHQRIYPEVLKSFVETNAWFKFVVSTEDCIAEVKDIVSTIGIPTSRVFIMPEGINATSQLTTLRTLAESILSSGFNISPRLHILIWGDERGR
ncbi:MAG: 7-carboxy-7-deazaguanine synthase QueE [Candidatus Caldarchaeum sp.]